jgi:excisionase family DNA binding protein
MDDTLLSPEDVAERLGISRLTAVRWLRSGKLKAQKFGRKTVRMKASDLDAFINQQQPALTLVDTTAPARASTPAVEQPFDADTLALAEKLRQPGESLSAVVRRALCTLAYDAQGGHAGETLNYDERKPAVLTRLWAMQDEGQSHQAMATQLNTEGVPTLSRRGQWQAGTVGKLLKAYPRHGC